VSATYLVKGTDPSLRDRVVDELVTEILGADDPTLALEDITIPGRASAGDDTDAPAGADGRDAAVAALLNAAGSPPFMTEHRVVVVRDVGALTAGDVDGIVRYLDDPLDSTILVFVAGGGTMPPALTKKLKEVKAQERAPESEKTDTLRPFHHAYLALDAEPFGARARIAGQHRAHERDQNHDRFVSGNVVGAANHIYKDAAEVGELTHAVEHGIDEGAERARAVQLAREVSVEHVAQPGQEKKHAAPEERAARHHDGTPDTERQAEGGDQHGRNAERRQSVDDRIQHPAGAVLYGSFVHG